MDNIPRIDFDHSTMYTETLHFTGNSSPAGSNIEIVLQRTETVRFHGSCACEENTNSYPSYDGGLERFCYRTGVAAQNLDSNNTGQLSKCRPMKFAPNACTNGGFIEFMFEQLDDSANFIKERHGANLNYLNEHENSDNSTFSNTEEHCYKIDRTPQDEKGSLSISEDDHLKELYSTKVKCNLNGSDSGEIFNSNNDASDDPDSELQVIKKRYSSTKQIFHKASTDFNKTSCKSDCDNHVDCEKSITSHQCSEAFRRNGHESIKKRKLKYHRHVEPIRIKTKNRYSCLIFDDCEKKTQNRNTENRIEDRKTLPNKKPGVNNPTSDKTDIRIQCQERHVMQPQTDRKVRRKRFQYQQWTLHRNQVISFFLVFLVAVCYGNHISLSSGNQVIFGQNVSLQCNIDNKTTLNHLAWLRKQDGEILTKDNMSSDPKKFQSEIENVGNGVLYRLMIFEFNESDTDPYYRCTFGFDAMSLDLSLNEKKFRYVPSPSQISRKADLKNGMLNISVVTEKIYPIPICGISIQEMSLNASLNTITEKRQTIYRAKLTYVTTVPDDICSITVIIKCRIGRETEDILNQQLNDCKINEDSSQENILVAVYTVISIILMVITVAISAYLLRRKFRECRSPDDSNITSGNQQSHQEKGLLMTDAVT